MPRDLFESEPPRTPTRLTAPVIRFLGSPAVDSFELKRILRDEAGARLSIGNRVTPLFTGRDSFERRAAMILGARHSIHLQTFVFASDDTGLHMAEMLAQRARDGLKVRVIYDAVGAMRSDPTMFAMMRNAGVELRKKSFSSLNRRWHEKHFIVDGRAAITGGMNIGAEYEHGGKTYVKNGGRRWGWRDKDAHVDGPAVRDFQFAFLRNWAKLGADVSEEEERELMRAPSAHADGESMGVVQSHPVSGETVPTSELLYYAFASARKLITIETPYLLPAPDTLQALLEAATRGVRVRIMTNSRRGSNHGVVNDAAEPVIRQLLEAGVEIYESPTMLHSKTATIDGKLTIIGSANLNQRSHFWDGEVASAVWGKKTAAAMQKHFEDHLPVTHFLMPEDLGHQSMMRRFIMRLSRPARSSL